MKSNMDIIFDQYLETIGNLSLQEKADFARCMVAQFAGYAELDKEMEKRFVNSYNEAIKQLYETRRIQFANKYIAG